MLSAGDVHIIDNYGSCSHESLSPFGKTDKLKIKVTLCHKISVIIKVSIIQYGNIQMETL